MSDENAQPNIGEMLSQILKTVEGFGARLDAFGLRLAALEEIVGGIDGKVDSLIEDGNLMRSQMDVLASDIHQVRAATRQIASRVGVLEKAT